MCGIQTPSPVGPTGVLRQSSAVRYLQRQKSRRSKTCKHISQNDTTYGIIRLKRASATFWFKFRMRSLLLYPAGKDFRNIVSNFLKLNNKQISFFHLLQGSEPSSLCCLDPIGTLLARQNTMEQKSMFWSIRNIFPSHWKRYSKRKQITNPAAVPSVSGG